MQTTDMKLRVPADIRAWIECAAKTNNRSLNAEILDIINQTVKRDPLRIFIHQCQTPTGEFFTASIGKHGDDFYDGPSKEDAFAAALKRAKELGIPRGAITFEIENFTAA